MNKDSYGEIINGHDTFREIAYILSSRKESVLIGWTDGGGSHYDILLTLTADRNGSQIQGGVSGGDLFVSVMRLGAFGFDPSILDTHRNYYEEKIGRMNEFTGEKFAELINGVKKELIK